MLKSLIALLVLAPLMVFAGHHVETEVFEQSQLEQDVRIDSNRDDIVIVADLAVNTANHYIGNLEAQSQNDARQDLYSDHIYSEVKKVQYQVQDIYGQLDRLDGAIAVNMANSSIVSTGQNGVSFGIGVGSYNSKNAVSSKLTYIETGFSFNVSAGISDNDNTPVYGAGLNYTF